MKEKKGGKQSVQDHVFPSISTLHPSSRCRTHSMERIEYLITLVLCQLGKGWENPQRSPIP